MSTDQLLTKENQLEMLRKLMIQIDFDEMNTNLNKLLQSNNDVITHFPMMKSNAIEQYTNLLKIKSDKEIRELEKQKQIIQMKIDNTYDNMNQKIIKYKSDFYVHSIQLYQQREKKNNIDDENNSNEIEIDEINHIENDINKDEMKDENKSQQTNDTIEMKENKETKENKHNLFVEDIDDDYIQPIQSQQQNDSLTHLKELEQLTTKEELQDEDIIEIIEKQTQLHKVSVLFDSKDESIEKGKTRFHDIMENKEKALFIVTDSIGNIFGGYVSESIKKGRQLVDKNAFLFSLRKNDYVNFRKFMIREDKVKRAFQLCDQNNPQLFNFGQAGQDLSVTKINVKNRCLSQMKSFDYPKDFDGFTNEKNFDLERIVVWQMRD